ncbi:MAG: metal ABC transporter solute-binding protein, Zn/Mn family, partial [Planctomycetaceae bacterium]
MATYSILGDWVRNVGGEHVLLTTLVGPGGDAHTYEPTPQDSAAVADAALLFENGLGFEVWLDRLFEASGS